MHQAFFLPPFQIDLRTFVQGSESEWRDSVFWTLTMPPTKNYQTHLPTRLPLPRFTDSGQCHPLNSKRRILLSTFGDDELIWINFSREESKVRAFYH